MVVYLFLLPSIVPRGCSIPGRFRLCFQSGWPLSASKFVGFQSRIISVTGRRDSNDVCVETFFEKSKSPGWVEAYRIQRVTTLVAIITDRHIGMHLHRAILCGPPLISETDSIWLISLALETVDTYTVHINQHHHDEDATSFVPATCSVGVILACLSIGCSTSYEVCYAYACLTVTNLW
jgi:hypothetical protein